jgi:adenylate cyclase
MALERQGHLPSSTIFRIELVDPKIIQFKGRVVGSAGDSLLVEFANPVRCCAMCNGDPKSNSPPKLSISPKHDVMFRMAINLGDVIAEGGTI